MTPATALFAQLEDLIARKRFGEAARVRRELERKHPFQVIWNPRPSGRKAEGAIGLPNVQKEKPSGPGQGNPDGVCRNPEQEGSTRHDLSA